MFYEFIYLTKIGRVGSIHPITGVTIILPIDREMMMVSFLFVDGAGKKDKKNLAGAKGFEPPIYSLGGCRHIRARPRAHDNFQENTAMQLSAEPAFR
jgi:hypothetical protein